MSAAKVLVMVERGVAVCDSCGDVEVIIVDRDVDTDERRVELPNDPEWKNLAESLFCGDEDDFVIYAS